MVKANESNLANRQKNAQITAECGKVPADLHLKRIVSKIEKKNFRGEFFVDLNLRWSFLCCGAETQVPNQGEFSKRCLGDGNTKNCTLFSNLNKYFGQSMVKPRHFFDARNRRHCSVQCPQRVFVKNSYRCVNNPRSVVERTKRITCARITRCYL